MFVSLLTQSQLFNTSTTNNYSNGYSTNYSTSESSPTNLVNLTNQPAVVSVTDSSIKMNAYHPLENGDELSNRKTNGRTTNQSSNRRCKKSKKSTIKFDSSYKENDDHGPKKVNKANANNKNKNQDQANRKTNLNDRLASNKKMRNSSSGTEGYSSLDDDDSASCRSANVDSPDLVGRSTDDAKIDHHHSTELHHLHHTYHMLNNGSVKSDDLDVHSDLNSTDHSTASSTTDLNVKATNLNNSTTTATSDFDQDEIEQSTEQYLGSIFKQLNVGSQGYLTLQELFIVCEHTMGLIDEELVKQLFDRLDEDKDGKVSFDELLKQLTSSSTSANLTNASGLSCEDLATVESYAALTKSSSTNELHLNDFNDTNNENDINELNRKETNQANKMNSEPTDSTNHHKSSLSLELSPYSSYKNYFKSSHESSSTYDKHPTERNEHIDNVDNRTESYYSLDSKLINQKSTNNSNGKQPASKHQRTNSFTNTSSDGHTKVPSNHSSSTNTQSSSALLNSNNSNNNNHHHHHNNQTCSTNQSDYTYTHNSKVFCHKRTNSVGNAHHTSHHSHTHCNKLLTNTSTQASSSLNPSSNESTFNQPSNLSSINERSTSELDKTSPCAPPRDPVNCSVSNHQTSQSGEQASGQGDMFNKRRFSSSNASTPELEHTQLLSSISSMHQFNSSHLYHHQSSNLTKEHHLDLSEQTSEEDDFFNLTGFGNFLSIDPFNYGYVCTVFLVCLFVCISFCYCSLPEWMVLFTFCLILPGVII